MEIEGTGDSLVLIEEPEGSVVQSERVPIKGVVVSGWYPEGADPVFRAMPQSTTTQERLGKRLKSGK